MKWTSMFVSYCQYEVFTATDSEDRLEIYTVGDDLLHVGGPSVCTAFTGLHTGDIEIRVVVSEEEPPAADPDDWEAVSETTLWCPDGRFTVLGLMGGGSDALSDIAVPRPGLIRIRVHARNRVHESVRTDDDPPEQHELHVWPVTEDAGPRTLLTDGSRAGVNRRPDQAAQWAMTRLVTPQRRGPGPDGAELPRVDVVRHRPAPARPPAERVLPAGDLEVHLTRAGADTLTWRWARAANPIFPDPVTALPDDRPTTVRLHLDAGGGLTLRHEEVPGRLAVTYGLLWDHLLDAPARPAWQAPLEARAAAATERAEQSRRREAERLSAIWGGGVPRERLRRLGGHARELARLDRPLLDQLAAQPAGLQRAIARFAARRAAEVAGLDRMEWIAEALDAADAGGPLPPLFTDFAAGFERLLNDPRLPEATVPMPRGPSHMLRAAVAFPALLALGRDDDLAAAVDTVYIAALTHGAGHLGFLAEVSSRLDADSPPRPTAPPAD